MTHASCEPSLSILRATVADLELAREAVEEIHHRCPCDSEALREFLGNADRYLLLAVERSRAVGSLNGYSLRHPHRRGPAFLLYEVDVHEECRRRGIGRALVEAFTAEARNAGAWETWVLTNESNQAAMALYAACGYRRNDRDDVMLALPLE